MKQIKVKKMDSYTQKQVLSLLREAIYASKHLKLNMEFEIKFGKEQATLDQGLCSGLNLYWNLDKNHLVPHVILNSKYVKTLGAVATDAVGSLLAEFMKQSVIMVIEATEFREKEIRNWQRIELYKLPTPTVYRNFK